MSRSLDRRSFLAASIGLAGLGAASVGGGVRGSAQVAESLFRISLAQWSFHKHHFANELDPLDFPRSARELGIDGVEYVNVFFMDRARDEDYLGDLRSRCEGEGVTSLLIMCDREGLIGDPNEAERAKAVKNHEKWLEAASFLGCHSIRVNAGSRGSWDEQRSLAADGLHRLCEIADGFDLNVLVENHGGLSSNARWLAAVMEEVAHPRVGTLPDFGNFRISEDEVYDRYQGVEELMPFAKSVSAKSYEFDDEGNDTTTDFVRMMKIVLDAGYRDWVGIEYEGSALQERDGIVKTRELLERVRDQLGPQYA